MVREGFDSHSKVVKNVYKLSISAGAGSICRDNGCGGRVGGRPNFSVYELQNKNIVNKLLPPLSSWYVVLLGGKLMRYVGAGSVPAYNLLKSLGWRVVKGRGVAGFLPSTVFSNYIAGRVADELRFGRWLEVVAAPRAGKSAGTIEGLVRWVVENDVRNYTVIVVSPNRRLSENLYKYALGATVRVYNELKLAGVALTRADVYERVRVRLYLGGEASCLLGRSVHYVEDCVERCELFRKYERKWRKLPPVPVLDVWNLKLAGYCPFIAASSKSFWYKSIVVVTADSLAFAVKNVLRHKIKRVIVVFDEYLVMLNKRGKVKQIDVKKLEGMFKDVLDAEYDVNVLDRNGDGEWVWVDRRLSLRNLFNIWNNCVRLIDSAAVDGYSELVEGFGSGPRLVDMINYALLGSVVDLKDVVSEKGYSISELITFMYSAANAVIEISRTVGDVRLSMKLRRLGYMMMNNASALVSAVGFVNPLRGELEGINRVVSIRWAEAEGEEGIIGWAGGWVRSIVSRLIDGGVELSVITTSVDTADVMFYLLYPHESFEHVRISLDAVVKRVESYSVPFNARGVAETGNGYESARTFSDLVSYLSDIMNKHGNSVVVGNKALILVSAAILRSKYKCDEVGDTVRGVVDYVVCDKPNGGKLLLVSPHSRVAMGVDPPISDPSEVVLLYGLRRPTNEYIKIKQFVNLYKRLVEEWGIRVMSFPDNTYFVYRGDDVKYSYVYIYDAFAAKYDVHMLIQVVGRWYMHRVEKILHNYKYDLMGVKYFLIDFGIFADGYAPFYIVRGFKRLGGFVKPILEPHNDFASAVSSVLDYARSKWTFEYFLEREYKSAKRALRRLRRVRDEWVVAKAVATVVNALEYIRRYNAPVPRCLKGVYNVFKEGGVEAVFNALKEMGVNVWLVRRFMSLRMRAPVLE